MLGNVLTQNNMLGTVVSNLKNILETVANQRIDCFKLKLTE
jgi:hypothetical protein